MGFGLQECFERGKIPKGGDCVDREQAGMPVSAAAVRRARFRRRRQLRISAPSAAGKMMF